MRTWKIDAEPPKPPAATYAIVRCDDASDGWIGWFSVHDHLAQFIVDACNAYERDVEESMRQFREATPNYHALKEDSLEEARLRGLTTT